MSQSSPTKPIEVFNEGRLLAIIIPGVLVTPGVTFFTGNESPQQVGLLCHPAGRSIAPHVHNPTKREISITQEVLLVRKGRVRVDFYTQEREYLSSRILGPGDTVVLMSGGHGFEAIEEVEIIEVKQGPYVGEGDKVRFEPTKSPVVLA